MQKIIDQILDGKFDYESGTLDFSRNKVEITIMVGESYEGSFTISADPGRVTEGYIYSSDARMECLTDHFAGAGEEIGFVFHGEGLSEGDVLKGAFYIISNQGEYTLPYSVMVKHTILDSSMGNIRNLFHFANLAKSSWMEAVSIFYAPEFGRTLTDSDKQFYDLYRGLSKSYMNEQNVEEFLIAVNKKQKVHYILDEDRIVLEDSNLSSRQEFLLTKNGWGFIRLELEASEDFIRLDRDVLTDDDFLGMRCTCYFTIDQTRLHKGHNYGTIRIHNAFVEMELPVQVTTQGTLQPDTTGLAHRIRREKQMAVLQLMDFYQQFRLKKMNTATWLENTLELVDNMIHLDDADPVPKLFLAQLQLTQERYNEATWTLDHAKVTLMQSDNMAPEIWCYYRYLTTLKTREEDYIDSVAREVESTYEKDPSNWRIAWLLLYLSPEYGRSASGRWLFLQELYRRGCNSPVIYLEALLMMKAEPALFMELGDFERQVLYYAAKHHALTAEMIGQLHYLVPREKNYDQMLYLILREAYDQMQDVETLTAICMLLMKGDKRGTEYFPYYEAGVAENLRITRLYEYYMYSVDLEDQELILPRVIFMYFSYNNNLDNERSSYLYANLLRNRERYPDLYENAVFAIQEFVLRMIRKGKIDSELSYIYREMLTMPMLDQEIRDQLAVLLFSQEIKVYDARAKKLVILQAKATIERSYVLIDGKAVAPIYGEDYTLLFEDVVGNRYAAAGEEYRLTKLMPGGRLLQEVVQKDFTHLGLQLYACDHGNGLASVNQENAQRFRLILDSELIAPDYKKHIVLPLVQFFYDQDRTEELDSLLERIEPDMLEADQRGEIIRYLVIRDMLEKAAEWVQFYGVHDMEPKTLVRLAGLLIKRDQASPLVLAMSIYAFEHSRYDLYTLQYLMDHYQGPTKILRDIWKAARSKELDLLEFSEKMLLQMLYTGYFVGEKMDIFRTYIQYTSTGSVNLSVEKAFIAQCAYDYFVKDKLMEDVAFEDMERLYLLGEELSVVCMLAYTKYYSEHRELIRQSQKAVLGDFLRKLYQAGKFLPYFTAYADLFPFMSRFYDKTMIQYKTRPGNKAVIHYMIEHEENQGGEYFTREMTDMYGGVCASKFVLFFGEKLMYYITEESDQGEELTESGNVGRSDIRKEVIECRFNALNDVVISEVLQDYETVDTLLEDYVKTDYLQRELFELI